MLLEYIKMLVQFQLYEWWGILKEPRKMCYNKYWALSLILARPLPELFCVKSKMPRIEYLNNKTYYALFTTTPPSLYLTKASPICLRDATCIQRLARSVPQYRHRGITLPANTCDRMAAPSRRFGSIARKMCTVAFAAAMKTFKIFSVAIASLLLLPDSINASISLSLRTIGKRAWIALRAVEKRKTITFCQ